MADQPSSEPVLCPAHQVPYQEVIVNRVRSAQSDYPIRVVTEMRCPACG